MMPKLAITPPRRPSMYPAAIGIVSVQALTMYRLGVGGSYFSDDFLFFGQLSADFHSRLGRHYLGTPLFGHYSPGLRFMFWVGGTVLHHDYALTLALVVGLYALVVLLTFRLLRLLFGDRQVNLLLIFVFGFSAMWTPMVSWWTTGAHHIPTMLFAVLTIDGFFRFVLRRQWWWLPISALTFSIGLLWHEKAILLLVLLPLVAGSVLARTSSPRAVVWAAARLGWVWLFYLVPAAIYLYYYFALGHYQRQPLPTPTGVVELLGIAWTRGFIPDFFGGPIDWAGAGVAIGRPPLWVILTTQLILVVLVVASFRLRGWRAWRAWVLPVVAVALYSGLAGSVRLYLFGPEMGMDERYMIDAAPIMVVALGLAFLPVVGLDRTPALPPARQRWLQFAGLASAALLLLGFSVSATKASNLWTQGGAAVFVHNLQGGLAHAPAGPDGRRAFFDTAAPEGVIPSSYSPYNKVSHFLPFFADRLEFNRVVEPAYLVDPQGNVLPARLDRTASVTSLAWQGTTATPPSNCATSGPQQRMSTFGLQRQLDNGQWFMLLRYTRAVSARIHVAVNTGNGDDTDATGQFEAASLPNGDGAYLLDFRVDPIRSVRLDLGPNGSLCLADLYVGRPVPTG